MSPSIRMPAFAYYALSEHALKQAEVLASFLSQMQFLHCRRFLLSCLIAREQQEKNHHTKNRLIAEAVKVCNEAVRHQPFCPAVCALDLDQYLHLQSLLHYCLYAFQLKSCACLIPQASSKYAAALMLQIRHKRYKDRKRVEMLFDKVYSTVSKLNGVVFSLSFAFNYIPIESLSSSKHTPSHPRSRSCSRFL